MLEKKKDIEEIGLQLIAVNQRYYNDTLRGISRIENTEENTIGKYRVQRVKCHVQSSFGRGTIICFYFCKLSL